jgi:hypothetical protein
VAAELGIEVPEVRFITEAASGWIQKEERVLGLCGRATVIDIVPHQPLRNLILVVAHEVRHAWQFATREYIESEGRQEADAEIFAEDFGKRLATDEHELLLDLVEIGAQATIKDSRTFDDAEGYIRLLSAGRSPVAARLQSELDCNRSRVDILRMRIEQYHRRCARPGFPRGTEFWGMSRYWWISPPRSKRIGAAVLNKAK